MSTRKRVLLIAAATLAVLPLAGAVYQAWSVRRESVRFPAPGRMIPVAGDRRLQLVCIGEGEPTVIFEPGGFTNALSFSPAREEISRHTRVCSYDRMGGGWSDAGPGVVSIGMLADDLERLTQEAGLRPPFVLVPSSMGGIVSEMFARRHPEQIAGLVFSDAVNSAIHERFLVQVTPMQVEAVCLAKTAARLGVLRMIDPFAMRREHTEAADRSISRLYRVEPMATLCAIARGLQATTQELAAAPALAPDVPLVVLVHERPGNLLPAIASAVAEAKVAQIKREWLELQQRFSQRSRRGTWRVVPGSDHLIAGTQPQAVAEAVVDMVAEWRGERTREGRQPLPYGHGSVAAHGAGVYDAQVARAAPAFTMLRVNQSSLRLSQYRGKVVALAFISTTCAHCQQLTVELNQIAPQYSGRGVQVLECAFNDDAAKNMADFLDRFAPRFPVTFSTGAAVAAFLQHPVIDPRPIHVPYLVFVDRTGVIRAEFAGDHEFFQNVGANVRAQLDNMIGGR